MSNSFQINDIIIDFLKQRKKEIVTYIVIEALIGYCDVRVPAIYGEICEKLGKKEDTTHLFATLIGTWSLSKISSIIVERLDATFLPDIQMYMRTNLVDKLIDAYKENYKEPDVARMIANIIKLPDTVFNIVYYIRSFITPLFFSVAWTMIAMFKIHQKLGIIYIVGMIAVLFQTIKLIDGCSCVSKEYDRQNQVVYEEIGDVLSNIINIYSNNTTDNEMKRLHIVQKEMNLWYSKTAHCGSKAKLIFNVIYIIFFGILNYFAIDLYKKGDIEFGQVTTAFVLMLNILNFMSDLGKQTSGLIFTVGVYQRIQRELNILAKSKRTKEYIHLPPKIEGNIIFKDVTVENSPVKNFSLALNPGEKIAIIGQIGSGKSSLVKALLKLRLYTGSITIDGHEIRDIEPNMLRQQLTYIAQSPLLFNRSIYDNILYGSNKTKDDVHKLIDKYSLQSVFKSRNLDDSAGKNGEALSGGQRQIVMLLRSLLCKKPILILDEPTASLNSDMKQKVLSIIEDISHECTLIIISHDPITKGLVNRTIELEGGEM